jgi:hypothetical protein
MTGGNSVTNKFTVFTNHLKTKNIALWGDEGYLFFEWVGPEESNAIIADIHKALAESGLRARIAHGFDTNDVAKAFKILDSSTKVHKIFEETIDSLAVQRGIDSNLLPRTVHIEVPHNIQEGDLIAWLKASPIIETQIVHLLDDIAHWINPIDIHFPYQWEGRDFITEIKYQWDLLNISFISQ